MTCLSLDFPTVAALTDGRLGQFDVPCPSCGPERRSPANRVAKKLRIWRKTSDFISFRCARCGVAGCTRADGATDQTLASPAIVERPAPTDAERTAFALSIWRQAAHPAESPVEAYLLSRGLVLPDEAAGEAIRWHAHCPFGKGARTGCMVTLVRDIHTDAPKAIHRTALTSDGRKAVINGASRLSLGPIGGGAGKLTPNADVSTCLGVGEGIETALSLRLLPGCEALPVWSLLAANQLAAFPVLPGIEGLWIAVDHDPTGIAAAETCQRRWQAAGVEAVTVRPKAAGADINDVVRLEHAS